MLAGFVLSKRADGQIQATYARANNYNPQVARGGQPYGAGFEEQSVTAGVKYKFTERLIRRRQGGIPAPDGRDDRRIHQLQRPAGLRRP